METHLSSKAVREKRVDEKRLWLLRQPPGFVWNCNQNQTSEHCNQTEKSLLKTLQRHKTKNETKQNKQTNKQQQQQQQPQNTTNKKREDEKETLAFTVEIITSD